MANHEHSFVIPPQEELGELAARTLEQARLLAAARGLEAIGVFSCFFFRVTGPEGGICTAVVAPYVDPAMQPVMLMISDVVDKALSPDGTGSDEELIPPTFVTGIP